MINHQKAPLNNVEFRRAAGLCHRPSGTGNNLSAGLWPGRQSRPGSPGQFLVLPGSCRRISYDPDKAEEILTSLGYVKNGNYFEKDGQTLELELLISSGNSGYPDCSWRARGETD